jgi:hypothetical protein
MFGLQSMSSGGLGIGLIDLSRSTHRCPSPTRRLAQACPSRALSGARTGVTASNPGDGFTSKERVRGRDAWL